jgi:hypothetical protein
MEVMEHASHNAPFLSSAGQVIFTGAEIDVFQTDDRSAATALIGLMVSIFSIGLTGYLCVAAWCRMW